MHFEVGRLLFHQVLGADASRGVDGRTSRGMEELWKKLDTWFSKHWPLVLPVPGEFILLAHPPPKVALLVPDVRLQACKATYSMSYLHCCVLS